MSGAGMAPPDHARAEWKVLQHALDGTETPCQMDPELWHSEIGTETSRAARWCRTCPVLDPCRTYALAAGEPWGVWAGLTAKQRKELQGRTGR